MKKIFCALALITLFSFAQAQDTKPFEIEKEVKTILKFREIVPDTFTADLLYDGNLIEGKVIRSRYKCTFDYNQKHEGDIYYAMPTIFLSSKNEKLESSKVLAWNIHGNGLALITNGYPRYWFNGSSTNVYCADASTSNLFSTLDSSPNIKNNDYLPGGLEFEVRQ